MARAMWKGAIQFGLVTIPVKLYLATESKGISFNMLHKDDLSRIQMKVWCPVEDEPISRSATVKGYEYSPGEYVVITDDDLENVPLKTVRSIEIEQFTRAERDDAAVRFVKSAYYLEPDKIGRKAFHLLKSVLVEDGLTAICKVVIKDREALAALDPFGDTMLLTTLHWPDEIRSVGELDLGDEAYDFKPAELAMAQQLVAAMTGEFDPAQYKDEYREALETIIQAKIEGKETVARRGARRERQPDRPDGGPRSLGQCGQGGPRRKWREAGVRLGREGRQGARQGGRSRAPRSKPRPTPRPRQRLRRRPRRDPRGSARRPDRPPDRIRRKNQGAGRCISRKPGAARRGQAHGRDDAGTLLAMPLDEYRRKRDFAKTPEPPPGAHGDVQVPVRAGRFVIQRHRATRLHYDFRLEVGGVLVSWAVPRGPTLDSTQRRMAIHVEDHPIEYFDFEGVIPAKQYGAGDVIVWDWGTWESEAPTLDARTAIPAGELKFRLDGQKVKGRFTIVRTSGRKRAGDDPAARAFEDDQGEQWLLIHKRGPESQPGWDAEDHPTQRQDRPDQRRRQGRP